MSTRTEAGGRSLQRRLLASMAAGFVVLLLVISALLWTYARAAADRTYDLLLAGAALSILERVAYGSDGPTVDLPTSAMNILSLAPDERVVYGVSAPGWGHVTGDPDLPLPNAAETGEMPDRPVFYTATVGDTPFRFILQGRQLSAQDGREWILVQVGQTLDARRDQSRSLFLTGLLGLGAVSVLGLGFVWLAIRISLTPLREIAAHLGDRAPGDLSPLGGQPPREVMGLFDAINGFIARLGQSHASTETFIADVAHQTRTSLSALQGHLSLAADAREPGEMRARLVKADRQAQRTVRLTNQLLASAMVIHRSERERLEPVALRPVVRDTLAEILRDSRMRSVTLTFDAEGVGEGGDVILGDALSIREALRNLVENAVRHGPKENTIMVEIAADDDRVGLAVEDAGPGIAEADRARATDRFTSIAAGSAGSGLGLSIVRAVAEGHDAGLTLSRSRMGGLRVAIAFPRILLILVALLALPARPGVADTLTVWSATDAAAIAPLLREFEAREADTGIDYVEFQTVDLHERFLESAPGSLPDVVISPSMDMQLDLVNRGLARRIELPPGTLPPEWAVWRSELFGFTYEPAAIIFNRDLVDERELPRTHRELATFIRTNEERLDGRIGGYDLPGSGIGYLYATQDAAQGLQAQRLAEVLGRAGLRTYCCTLQMARATAEGELALAFNVIGSYALDFAAEDPRIGVHFLKDYNLVMTRTAFVPKGAGNPAGGARLVAFLLSDAGQFLLGQETPLIPIRPASVTVPVIGRPSEPSGNFLPIRLGPSLLTYLDPLKRQDFLLGWSATLRLER
ncbi:extracellular solute-binding protein [Palleronia sp. LCG004]|uniref:sensor histidine kinase n=1 Tax=Palleronia sp. LCG004 TaxID=3079304 RepID=UPI00294324B0|nr:extracellular solute-binding protein [Palleronia sp. LCG004]WOI57966.1 extracellular solute-binding protein [Palleronia sp. LCG004]